MSIFTTVCADIRERSNREHKRIACDIQYWNDILRHDLVLLTKVTNDYVLTGIADVECSWGIHVPAPGCKRGTLLWSTYFRRMAHEMRRPFVFSIKWGHSRMLRIERRKYTEPLVATLLLISEQTVWRRSDTVAWRFTFTPGEGEALYQGWKRHCQTERATRQALRLV